AFGDFVIGIGNDFTGFRVDDVGRQHAPDEEIFGDGNTLDAGIGQVTNVLGRDSLVLLDENGAIAPGDVEAGNFALPALRYELEHAAFRKDFDLVEFRSEERRVGKEWRTR